jgi:hypothetical protein
MSSKVVIDDGRRCPKGARVAFVPAEPGSRTLRMVEDSTGAFKLRSKASLRMGDTMLLHVTVKKKKKWAAQAEAAVN